MDGAESGVREWLASDAGWGWEQRTFGAWDTRIYDPVFYTIVTDVRDAETDDPATWVWGASWRWWPHGTEPDETDYTDAVVWRMWDEQQHAMCWGAVVPTGDDVDRPPERV